MSDWCDPRCLSSIRMSEASETVLFVTFWRYRRGKRPDMAPAKRRPLGDDDLLSGFDRSGPKKEELRGFFAANFAASLYAWDAAFNFGTHHAVFYQRIQELLVLSSVVLVGTVVVRGQTRVHRWVLVAFLPPVLLFLFRLATPSKHVSPAVRIADDGLIIVNIVAFPLILLVAARLLAPEYFSLPTPRLKIATVVIVIGVALAGYLAGKYNYRVMTCHDFVITGADPPTNCRRSGHP
jgi:hypothetical protein